MIMSAKLNKMLLAISILAAPALAQAAYVNGTLGFIPFGAVSAPYSGGSLANATSVSMLGSTGTNTTANTGELVNGLPATYNGIANDFNAANGFALLGGVYQSATTLTIGTGGTITNAAITDYFGFGGTNGNRFQFNMISATKGMTGTALTLVGSGTLHDINGLYQDTAATFSLITSGSSSTAITNYAVSFATVAPVPLPAAALLFGSGLTGLLGFARRPKKVA